MDMGVVLPCPSKAFLIKAKERVNTVCVCVYAPFSYVTIKARERV